VRTEKKKKDYITEIGNKDGGGLKGKRYGVREQ